MEFWHSFRLPKRYRTYNKYSELTQSNERVSESVPGVDSQIMDNQVIAHVIEEDIEGFEGTCNARA